MWKRATLLIAALGCGSAVPDSLLPEPRVGSGDSSASAVVLKLHGAAVTVVLPAGLAEPLRAGILEWVSASAHAVGTYYGGFPVVEYRVDIELTAGRGIGDATTWPGQPPHTTIAVGRGTDKTGFDRDWVMVHEMTHLAFPSVADRHHWIEEGLATYLEPWERVAVGRLTPETAWRDFVRDLPQGVPAADARGFDHTSTWASTYWGGALYCFLADLEIRERTGNRLGLRDAVRAIAREGGMAAGPRELPEILAIGDRAVGTPALTDTWNRVANSAVAVDLPAIWAQLGIERVGDSVRFHDDAPGSAIRKAIAP